MILSKNDTFIYRLMYDDKLCNSFYLTLNISTPIFIMPMITSNIESLDRILNVPKYGKYHFYHLKAPDIFTLFDGKFHKTRVTLQCVRSREGLHWVDKLFFFLFLPPPPLLLLLWLAPKCVYVILFLFLYDMSH